MQASGSNRENLTRENTRTSSMENQISPTDGYFNTRDHPQELYVDTRPNPETSKNREATVESLLQSNLSSSAFSDGPPTPSSSSTWSNETTPLIRRSTPPPAYSTAGYTPPRPTNDNPSQERHDYGSQPPAAESATPQVMGDIDIEAHGDRGPFGRRMRWKRQDRSSRIHSRKRMLAKMVLVLLLLTGLVWAASAYAEYRNRESPDKSPQNSGPQWPSWPDLPDMPDFPDLPNWSDICSNKATDSKTYEFPHLENFRFTDPISDYGEGWGTFGSIYILSGSEDQQVDLRIEMKTTQDDFIVEEEMFTGSPNVALAFGTSPAMKAKSAKSAAIPCLGADIVLYFRPGLRLSNLEIISLNLDIYVSSKLTVSNTTLINLQSGKLKARPFISSRQTYIETGSNSISGKYALFDLLSISSKSGSVSIGVDPKEIDKEHPVPAIFSVRSKSGSIGVQFPLFGAQIPEREYHTTVASSGGSISGRYIHGTQTYIDSSSGSISIELLPYVPKDATSTLTTMSVSGSQTVTLLSPYIQRAASSALSKLRSYHSAKSGKLELRYPDEWEGRFEGESKSGSLYVKGRDVRVIEEGSRYGGKYVIAEKGDGDSAMKFETKSGSVDATFGF